jgi:hypothetical protein
MKRLRIERSRGPRARPEPEVLPLDPRDPDVVRAKNMVRSRAPARGTEEPPTRAD